MEQPLPTVLVDAPQPPAGEAPLATALAAPPSFRVGTLLSGSFRAWARGLAVFLPLGLLSHVPLAIGTWFLYTRHPEYMRGATPADVAQGLDAFLEASLAGFGRMVLAFLPYSLASGLLSLVVMGAVTHGAARRASGQRAGMGESLLAALRGAPALFVAGLLAWLACLPATLALVVPGVVLALAWSLTAPVIVVERVGPLRALRRSWELTRGHRGQLFLGFLVVWLVMAVAVWIVQMPIMAIALVKGISAGVSGRAPGADLSAALALPTAIAQIAQGAAQTLLMVVPGVAYVGLRTEKEGMDPEQLREVFE